MKFKTLPPTLREKKRYIAFTVESDYEFSGEEIKSLFLRSTLSLLGEVGVSRLSLRILKATKDYLIVACNHRHVQDVIACGALISEHREKKLHLVARGVSGTLRALHKKFLSRSKEIIQVDKKVSFMGKQLKAEREYYSCVDLIPDGELLDRAQKIKVKYIGVMKEDIER